MLKSAKNTQELAKYHSQTFGILVLSSKDTKHFGQSLKILNKTAYK